MSNMVEIEVQDQFGAWHYYTSVTNNPSSIKLALQTAIKTQLASKSRRARAIDEKTGVLIDMLQG
ncbi:hypothetical protein SAMN06296273_2675 [Nitrosomonas ureae]|uniref:Uncharacterized protein n=1 Tax=Nitrosomonas ureae TaxID=44577 RepID=A0A285C101_9PROT|nr:hypothetical protein [Nitrosomonas ureae]SNX61222.1 hypothetical protein SAMN06296273_2675 [Nitrosomonas ureae]